MVLVKISRDDIERGKQWSCTECPLAESLKRAYEASTVKVYYNNFNLGSEEKPNWAYRGYAKFEWKNAATHPTWKFDKMDEGSAYVMIALPKLMTKWAADFDRIGNARSVSFRVKWHPQQR